MMNCKRYLSIFSLTVVAFFTELAINIACGWEPDPYDYYVSYFHNNIAGDAYQPFMFTAYSYMYTEQEAVSEASLNSREWADYLGNVKAGDVQQVMYHTGPATDSLIHLFLSDKHVPLPDSLQNNSYLQAMAKSREARNYFLFAKSTEPLAQIDYDPWNPAPLDTAAMLTKATEAWTLCKKIREDEFMKLRYAYQAARMFHYATDYENCIKVYESEIKPLAIQSSAKGWATSLYAGALRRVGQPVRAAFLFSKVFETNPERRIQAYKNFQYIDVPIEEVMALASTKNEKAAILAIQGFGHPDLDFESLSALYKLRPESPLVAPLLIREVNKLEERLLEVDRTIPPDYYYTPVRQEYRQAAVNEAKKLRGLALAISEAPVVSFQALGTITAAYLSWMINDDRNARVYLATLNPKKLNESLLNQYRITQLLINLNAFIDHRDIDNEALLAALKWLDDKRYAENGQVPSRNPKEYYEYSPPEYQPFTSSARNIYQNILAPAYLHSGDTALAALAMMKGDMKYIPQSDTLYLAEVTYRTQQVWQEFLQPGTMKKLEVLKKEIINDTFIDFLSTPLKRLSNDDFYELFGTTYLRTHQYAEALACFNKISSDYQYAVPQDFYEDNKKAFSNPFNTTIRDYPKAYDRSEGINKKQFAQKMFDLQKDTQKENEEAAKAYYLMANAVYQTGTFGNAWSMISYSWTSNDNYYTDSLRYYDGDFKFAHTAEQWYLKARSLSTDIDFKARCTFMLAKCAQKQFTFSEELHPWDFRDKNSPFVVKSIHGNPYFKELSDSYARTAFYKAAVGECSYLRDFISGR